MGTMHTMQLNKRIERYEGFTGDGHFITVTTSRWDRERRRYRKEEAAQLLDPAYWLGREADYRPEVMVWAPRSFLATEARIVAGQGQLLYTAQPPLVLFEQLHPQAFIRPTPLGYGIQLVFPGVASVLRGHLQDAATLFSILHAHGIGSVEQWDIAKVRIGGVPMPTYRLYNEAFPVHVASKTAATIGEMLCAALVPAHASDQQDGATAEEQRAKDFTQRFKVVALQIGNWFMREYTSGLKGWKRSAYPPGALPEVNDLARMVEATLWQRFYEEWSGYAPDEEWCRSLGDYLCNLLFQLMCLDVFVALPLPLQKGGESGKDKEL